MHTFNANPILTYVEDDVSFLIRVCLDLSRQSLDAYQLSNQIIVQQIERVIFLYRNTTGQGTIPHVASSAALRLPSLRGVDLFSGAGGFSLGAMRAGVEVIAAFDHKQAAVDVYNANLGGHALCVDLKDLHTHGPLIRESKPDLIFGGPPCQDFSPAGEGVEGDEADMTKDFAMFVGIVRPRYFVMENVPRARRSLAYQFAKRMLVEVGYGLTEVELDACFYGTAQRRVRLFLIGCLGEADGFLESALRQAAATEPMTMRHLFGPDAPAFVYWHPRFPNKRAIFGADEPHPTVRNASRPQSASYVPHPADANYALLQAGCFSQRPYFDGPCIHSIDMPAPTVIRTSIEGARPKDVANPHPLNAAPVWRAVRLSRYQLGLVQGFPGWWDWSTVRLLRDRDQFVANAVPSPLAEAVIRAIVEREAGLTCPDVPAAFREWLRPRHKRQVSYNMVSRLKRAWKLCGGRTFADTAIGLATLERSPEFHLLTRRDKSHLRSALHAWGEWRAKW